MIILEGPDGAGKTRLALRLAEELSLTPEPRRVSSDMKPLVSLYDTVSQDIKTWPRKALYDRHSCISETIYAPLFRERPNDGFDTRDKLIQVFADFFRARPLVIYCLPSLAEVTANVLEDPNNTRAARQITGVYWLYHFQACRNPDSVVWDYTKPGTYESLMSWIKSEGKKRHGLHY